jgi:hypothetical protein
MFGVSLKIYCKIKAFYKARGTLA